MSDFSGYPIDREDHGFLATLVDASDIVPLVGSYEEVRLDPRTLVKVENQGPVGSCQGHALSSVVEWCYTIATSGQVQQLSRAYAYYESQRIDGITGDAGSTISGGVKLALSTGLPTESTWPYVPRYNSSRPANWQLILDEAKKFKIATATKVKTYDSFRSFLGSGCGGISIGIAWGDVMNASVVERFSRGNGGHAIAALCLSERVDSQGRPYAWILNSWGESFGSREHPGWHEWSPTAITQMLTDSFTEMIGLSDMPTVKPRRFSKDEWIARLRP